MRLVRNNINAFFETLHATYISTDALLSCIESVGKSCYNQARVLTTISLDIIFNCSPNVIVKYCFVHDISPPVKMYMLLDV